MKIKPIKAMLIFMVILAAIILIGSYSGGQATYTIRTVTVQPGDTLWELGEQYAPKANREEWIHNVCEINNTDACLQVGQTIRVEVER